MSKYALENLNCISEKGLNPDLCQLAKDDAEVFRVANIENDEQRNLYIYIENFVEDILDELKIKDQDLNKVIIDSFNKLKNKKDVELYDIKKAIIGSVTLINKKAYPNFLKTEVDRVKPKYDVEKWISSLNEIYSKMYSGESKNNASKDVLEGWNNMEKEDFNNWSKFYEQSGNQKYNIKTASPLDVPKFNNVQGDFYVKPLDIDGNSENNMSELELLKSGPGRPKGPSIPKTPIQLKKDLINRLTGAEKILQQFAEVWPTKIWEALDQALSDLRRQIVLVQTASTEKDCIIRTANRWNHLGFSEGASVLMKIADDVTDEIANALQGKREKATTDSGVSPEEPMVGLSGGEEGSERGSEGDNLAPPEMPHAGVGEELPPPQLPLIEEELPEVKEEPLEPTVEEEFVPKKESNNKSLKEDNPYFGKTIEDVVGVLEPTAQQLSERKVVRELTKVDMMLDALNIASHFPELGEAIAKMIESTIYVHTRLEKVISKLKGGLSESASASNSDESAPVIEMEEIKHPEKEMFEVGEE